MFDFIGNVWEWTETPFNQRSGKQEQNKDGTFATKGGSYLDSRRGHVNLKARSSARKGFAAHYAAGNLGFRCAKNLEVAEAVLPNSQREQQLKRMATVFAKQHSEL